MNYADVLIVIITGIFGLLSLVSSLNSKCSKWKKYTIPLGASLEGFAVGLLTTIFFPGTVNFPSEYLLFIVIVSIVVLAGLYAIYITLKFGSPFITIIIAYLIYGEALPKIFNFYEKIIQK